MRNLTPFIARVLLSVIFIKAGFGKVMDPSGTQQYMAAYGMPLTGFFLAGAIVAEIAGGLSILLGYKARWGALALFLFLIPTTLIFHTEFSDRMQVIMFTKNMAIMGGLLLLTHFGPGPISLDGGRAEGDS
jgi:putative oxidoreductase